MASDSDYVYEVCDHFVEFAHSDDVRRIDDIMSRFRTHVLADERAVLEAAERILRERNAVQVRLNGPLFEWPVAVVFQYESVFADTLADAIQKLKEGGNG